MSKKILTIAAAEKATKEHKFIALKQADEDNEELTLEIVYSPEKTYYYFKNSYSIGRESISRTEASELLKKNNVYSS